MLYTVLVAIVKCILPLIFKVEVVGKENIPKGRGLVVCANHQYLFDPVFIAVTAPLRFRFMGKAELFKNPIVSWFFKKIGAFPVERGKGDTTAIDTAVEAVKMKQALIIFPEGTRSKTGELLRFKSGAGVIASKTEADILPVAINYKGKLKFRSRVRIAYLPVISYKDLAIDVSSPRTIKVATALIRNTIAKGLEENKYDQSC